MNPRNRRAANLPPSRELPARGMPPPSQDSSALEAVLRRALVERNESALGEAIRLMRPAMNRVALDHVHSPDDADDLIQETWLAALSGIRRFQGRALLSTWLLRILSYRARTMATRAARWVPFSRLPATASDAWASPADPVIGSRPVSPDEAVAP